MLASYRFALFCNRTLVPQLHLQLLLSFLSAGEREGTFSACFLPVPRPGGAPSLPVLPLLDPNNQTSCLSGGCLVRNHVKLSIPKIPGSISTQ